MNTNSKSEIIYKKRRNVSMINQNFDQKKVLRSDFKTF